jgi:hypothetical protein
MTQNVTKKKKKAGKAATSALSFEEWVEMCPVPAIVCSDQPEGQNVHWVGFARDGDSEVEELFKAIGWVNAVMFTKAEISAQLTSLSVTLWNRSKKLAK